MFGEIESVPFDGGIAAFERKIQQRESELIGADKARGRSLRRTIAASPSARGLVTERKIFGRHDFGFEAYKLDHGLLFSLIEKSFDEDVFNKKVLTQLQTELLPNLCARKIYEIPTEPGLFIRDGFIADNGNVDIYEHARMQLNFKQWPDMWVKFTSMTVHRTGRETLLQRLAKFPITPLEKAFVKVFRQGKHDVNGRKGEEILELLPTDQGIKQHSFRWAATGEINRILVPDLTIELDSGLPLNGVPRRPSLSDQQAIELFDHIIKSVRLRPTGGDKRGAVDVPKPPLGALAPTGSACPQSGWWQCAEDSGDVAGGQRRHFQAGEPMPDVVLLGPPTLLQRLKGERPTHRTATVWQLVAYDTPTAEPDVTTPPPPSPSE